MYNRLLQKEPFLKALFFFSYILAAQFSLPTITFKCSAADATASREADKDNGSSQVQLTAHTNGAIAAALPSTAISVLPEPITVKPVLLQPINHMPAQDALNKSIIPTLAYLFDSQYVAGIEEAARADGTFRENREEFRRFLIQKAWTAATATDSPLQAIIGRLYSRVVNLQKLVPQLQDREGLLRRILQEKEELLRLAYIEIKELKAELATKNILNEKLQSEVTAKEEANVLLKRLVDMKEEQNTQLRESVASGERTITELKASAESAEETTTQLRRNVTSHEETISRLTHENVSKDQTIRRLTEEGSEKERMLQQLKSAAKPADQVVAAKGHVSIPINDGEGEPLLHKTRATRGMVNWKWLPTVGLITGGVGALITFLIMRYHH